MNFDNPGIAVPRPEDVPCAGALGSVGKKLLVSSAGRVMAGRGVTGGIAGMVGAVVRSLCDGVPDGSTVDPGESCAAGALHAETKSANINRKRQAACFN